MYTIICVDVDLGNKVPVTFDIIKTFKHGKDASNYLKEILGSTTRFPGTSVTLTEDDLLFAYGVGNYTHYSIQTIKEVV